MILCPVLSDSYGAKDNVTSAIYERAIIKHSLYLRKGKDYAYYNTRELARDRGANAPRYTLIVLQ